MICIIKLDVSSADQAFIIFYITWTYFPSKRSRLEIKMNQTIIQIFLLLLVICAAGAIGALWWETQTGQDVGGGGLVISVLNIKKNCFFASEPLVFCQHYVVIRLHKPKTSVPVWHTDPPPPSRCRTLNTTMTTKGRASSLATATWLSSSSSTLSFQFRKGKYFQLGFGVFWVNLLIVGFLSSTPTPHILASTFH